VTGWAVALGARASARSTSRPPLPLLGVAAVVGVLAVLPLAYLAIRALEGDGATIALLLRPRTAELVTATLVLGLAVGACAVAVGVPVAWLTTRTDLPGRRAWSVLAIAPLAIPSYVLAFAVVGALGPRGWVTDLLEPLGVHDLPSIHGLPGAVLVLTLATTPYVVLATRAALVRLDPGLEEAARSLGDRPWSAARVAVLPIVLPAVGAGATLAMLYAISDFGAPSILRYDSLPRAIYTQYRSSFDRSGAAALALVLVGLALVLVWAEARIRRRAALRRPHAGRRAPRMVRLGRWRVPGLLLCSGLVALSLVLPASTVVAWLVRGLGAGVAVGLDVAALRDSLQLGIVAAVAATSVGLPLAQLVVHHPGRVSELVERLLSTTYAVPGISLALAVVAFTLNVVPTFYQSFAALAVVVGLRFLVQPVGALKGPMLGIGQRTVEAARALGEGRVGVLRTITLPLLRPGILAGAALVLLSALKELPITLLVAPTGFRTLAVETWDAAREGFFTQAAVPALLLLLVSSVSVLLLARDGVEPAA
jgi:iron(III) transport system permease protein